MHAARARARAPPAIRAPAALSVLICVHAPHACAMRLAAAQAKGKLSGMSDAAAQQAEGAKQAAGSYAESVRAGAPLLLLCAMRGDVMATDFPLSFLLFAAQAKQTLYGASDAAAARASEAQRAASDTAHEAAERTGGILESAKEKLVGAKEYIKETVTGAAHGAADRTAAAGEYVKVRTRCACARCGMPCHVMRAADASRARPRRRAPWAPRTPWRTPPPRRRRRRARRARP